jgi:hypothetical protein
MTDNLDAGAGAATGTGLGADVKAAFTGEHAVYTGVGLVAGIVAFVGYFVDFFAGSGNALSQAGSSWYGDGWYVWVPIFVGLATVGLFLPRIGLVFSGFAMGALGIALGIRGTVNQVTTALRQPGPGYAAGFWMIVIGSALLTLAWVAILARGRQRA